jgi:hypothetical protein
VELADPFVKRMVVPQVADLPAVLFADLPAEQFVELADPFVEQIAAAPIDPTVAARRLLPSHPIEDRQRVRCEYSLQTRIS